jgi:hypothetical protein
MRSLNKMACFGPTTHGTSHQQRNNINIEVSHFSRLLVPRVRIPKMQRGDEFRIAGSTSNEALWADFKEPTRALTRYEGNIFLGGLPKVSLARKGLQMQLHRIPVVKEKEGSPTNIPLLTF